MRTWTLASLALVPALALGGCGGTKNVDPAKYTCAQFNTSLDSKSDDSAGNYINQLRKQAKLNQAAKVERREMAVAIYFACRGKPGSTKPAATAVANVKQIKAHKFTAPPPPTKKKSNK